MIAEPSVTPRSRPLTIVFWGMACFTRESPDRLHVMLPDGRENNLGGVWTHYPMFWIRPIATAPTCVGVWAEYKKNNFCILRRTDLRITGLLRTQLNADDLDVHLPRLKKAPEGFDLDERPGRQSIVEMDIDRGTLTARRFPQGAIAVRWNVEVADGDTVTIHCGEDSLKLHPATTMVTIANAARSREGGADPHPHFALYRKIAKVKQGHLSIPKFTDPPDTDFDLEPPDPFETKSPLVDCSGAGYP